MDIKGIFLDNYVMLYELIGLLVIMGVSAHLSDRMKRLTVIVVVLLILEAVVFRLEQWTQTFETLSIARPLLTAFLYSLYPAILMTITSLIGSDRFTRKDVLVVIPWAVCVPLFFSSQWTHLVCWYWEENHYAGGPVYFLPYLLFGFYVFVFLIRSVRFFKNYSRRNRIASRYIVSGSILGLGLFFFLDGYRDYSTIFTSAVLLFYVLIYIHMAKMDQLTSLPNRQGYYQDMKYDKRIISAVISIDMNNLKTLNDNCGHEAGDTALAAIADIIRRHCPAECTAYRMGGDEFLIVCRNIGEFEVLEAISGMRSELSESPYSCSFGYAMRKEGSDLDETIRNADDRMYVDKAVSKKGQAEESK